jgi:hypothetical protein
VTVLKIRYRLAGGRKRTLEKLGQRSRLTQERISQRRLRRCAGSCTFDSHNRELHDLVDKARTANTAVSSIKVPRGRLKKALPDD